MTHPGKSIMKRRTMNLRLTSVIITIAVGVLLPVILSTAAGIVALVFADNASVIVMGVLIISLTVTAAGSGLIAVVLAGKKARLARLQSDFVANVSHEFRTPLSAIRLYTQTLQSGKLDNDPEQAAACLSTILRETEWLNLLVERALTWRASSKDRLELHMKRAPVSPSIQAAVERFQTMVAPEGLSLSVTMDSERTVHHDESALHSVILNLLTNAYKYTGDDKQIQVSTRDVEDTVEIHVSDNGVGLSPAEIKQVFHPFYRTHKQGRETSGVGLGLAIAQVLVNRHQGTIGVTSQPNQGCTFTITLPAEPAP
jgi:two-component system phosphate regulon sensor histidine kinase PhoR